MANELVIHYPTGNTLYALLFDATGQVWNGSTFAAPSSASWTDYDIAITEVATSTGIYRASMPAAAAGVYGWVVRKQAGANPAVGDVTVGAGKIEWSGTAEVTLTSRATQTSVDDVPTVAEFEARTLLAADYVVVSDTLAAVTTLGSVAAGGITSASFASGAITAAAIATDAIGSNELAASAATEIAAAVLVGGSGTYSYSDTVDDGSGNLLDGVYVQLATDSGFTNIVNATHTNSLGAFTVYSDTAGTHYLRLQLAGYEFAIQTVITA